MKKHILHCLTLRIEPELDEVLTEACWDHRTTKAAWIRAAIQQSLGIHNPAQPIRSEKTR